MTDNDFKSQYYQVPAVKPLEVGDIVMWKEKECEIKAFDNNYVHLQVLDYNLFKDNKVRKMQWMSIERLEQLTKER